jgi:hypothetical protein
LKLPVRILFTVFLLFSVYLSLAQERITVESVVPEKSTAIADSSAEKNELDMIDMVRRLQKKKTARTDMGGAHLSALPVAGYSLQTGLAAVLSANLGFYTTDHHHETEKISSILSSFTYSQYNQIIFPVQADIWTKGSRYNIITDWRYLKYPSRTFGLGGRSSLNNGYTIDFNYIKLHQTLLRRITADLYGGLGYYYDYFWNVKEIDPPAGSETSFKKYGLTNTVRSSGIALRLLYDSRRNQINPANGWFGSIVYRPNFTFMGSDNNWQSLLIELRKYIKFPAGSKNVLAFWSYNWLTLGTEKPPYLLLPSTGWDDFYNTGRGYIQGRYRGKDMLYFESEYRFGITNNGLLGGVLFVNAESFSKELSKQLAVVAPACGLGVRIKLNKFSGANLCVDYGFGADGSRGISVNLGEVF